MWVCVQASKPGCVRRWWCKVAAAAGRPTLLCGAHLALVGLEERHDAVKVGSINDTPQVLAVLGVVSVPLCQRVLHCLHQCVHLVLQHQDVVGRNAHLATVEELALPRKVAMSATVCAQAMHTCATFAVSY